LLVWLIDSRAKAELEREPGRGGREPGGMRDEPTSP